MDVLHVAIYCVLATLVASQDGSEIPDFAWDEITALDEYVHRDDGMFSWYLHDTVEYQDVTVYLVNMTSQKWLDESRVTRSVWWHMMGVAIPDEAVIFDTAFLYVDAGNNEDTDEDWPDRVSYFNMGVATAANDTGMVWAWMKQVPNQPTMFHDDPLQRYRNEDAIIAYTWEWVIERLVAGETDVDTDIVLRNPMTKAAVRGFDAVAEVVASHSGDSNLNITKFIPSGGSKRGWTAWSAAAVDQRVIATAPLVMSLLYFEETVMAHFMAMDGAYSYALKDYYEHNLTQYLTDPIAQPLLDIEDMFRFRSRLSMIPKMMVSATGDQFFLTQDTHTWWDLMGGVKHMMMNPNCEHDLFPHWLRIYNTIISWVMIVVNDGPEALPVLSWTREVTDGGGVLTFSSDMEPVDVRGMVALTHENTTRRDFRMTVGWPEQYPQEVPWDEGVVEILESDPIQYRMTEDVVDGVWKGFFMEGEWPSEYFDRTMWFTTEAHIIPDDFPHGPCEGEECTGYLV